MRNAGLTCYEALLLLTALALAFLDLIRLRPWRA